MKGGFNGQILIDDDANNLSSNAPTLEYNINPFRPRVIAMGIDKQATYKALPIGRQCRGQIWRKAAGITIQLVLTICY